MDRRLGDERISAKYYPGPDDTHPHHEQSRHNPQDEQEPRDSLGFDCVPGMVDDQGSETSTDDYEHHGGELWDSFWQSRMKDSISKYPALLSSPAPIPKVGSGQDLSRDRKSQLHMPHDQRSQPSAPLFGTTAERKRSTTPKPKPRASYSIFPPAGPLHPRSSLSRSRNGSVSTSPHSSKSSLDTPRPKRCEDSPSRHTTTSNRTTNVVIPNPSRAVPRTTIRTVTYTPGSSILPFPPLSVKSSKAPYRLKPLPDLPPQARATSRRPSLTNLRKLSFSRIKTNSTPSLARLSQCQAHQAAKLNIEARQQPHPLKEATLFDQTLRPLPPLPYEPLPELPITSVFDFDSDTESIVDNGPARGLARRLIRGIAHPLRKEKTGHQRSTSDGRTTRTEERHDCTDEHDVDAANKPWLTRQSSEMLGRILGRWSA